MQSIVIFDGVCNLCNGIVRFIAARDMNKHFLFAWNQSDAAKQLISDYSLDTTQVNAIILIHNNTVFSKSDAVLLILKMLGNGWQIFYLFRWIPKFIRDGVYRFIANNRYSWFGRSNECKIPDEKLRERFLSN